MAKIKPLATIESMSGRVCVHSDMYFRTNKVTGKTFTGKLCNPYKGPATEPQSQNRTRFGAVSAAIRQRIADLTVQDRKALEAEYKSQHKIGSLFGYAMHKWNDEYDEHGALIGD